MPQGGGDFLIKIRTQFESTGLEQVVAQARQALASLGSVNAGDRGQAAVGLRTAAEQRLTELRQTALQGVEPGSQQARDIGRQFGEARTALGNLFKQIAADASQLGIANKGVRDSVQAAARQASEIPKGTVNSLRNPVTAGPVAPDRAYDARSKAQEQALTNEAIAIDGEYIDAQRRATVAKQQSQASIASAIAADEDYARAAGEEARARRLTSARSRAFELGTDLRGINPADTRGIEVANSIQARIEANLKAAAVARAGADRESAAGLALAQSEAELRAANRVQTQIRERESALEVRQAIQSGNGTWGQRVQASVQRPGTNMRLPEEFQTFPKLLASKAITTAGFAVAGSALYGSVQMLANMEKEAEELDKILNQVNRTLIATGNAGQDGFGRSKQGILDIAAGSGQQADQVAKVYQQFIGAFGDGAGPIDDVNIALERTEQAMRVVAVTGLSLDEVLDSLVATSKTFDVAIDSVSDSALGLQERFGVLANETITFVADLAPVAEDIGLSLQDLASIGAVAQQVSGKSGSALAENFNRILPAIQDARQEILQFYSLPQLRGDRQQVLANFATGDTGQVFENLIRNYHKLTAAQQQQLVTTLASRRETATLIPLLRQSAKLTQEFDANAANPGRDQGKTLQYFHDLQSTMDQTRKRVGEIAKQIGQAVFDSGLARFFEQIIDLGGHVFSLVAGLTRIFASFNNALGGIPGNLLIFVGLMRLLSPLIGRVTAATAAKNAADEGQVAAAVSVTRTNEGFNIVLREQNAVLGQNAEITAVDTAAKEVNATAATQQAVTGRASRFGGTLAGGPRGIADRGAQSFANLLFGGGSLIKPGWLTRGGAGIGGGINPGIAGGAAESAAVAGAQAASAEAGVAAGGLSSTLGAAVPIMVAFQAVSGFFQNAAEQAEKAKAESEYAYTALKNAQSGNGLGGESPEQAIARLRTEALKQMSDDKGGILGAGGKALRGSAVGDVLKNLIAPGSSLIPGIDDLNIPGQGLAANAINWFGGSASDALGKLPGIGGLFGGGGNARRAAGGVDPVIDNYNKGIAKEMGERYSELLANTLQFREEDFTKAVGDADLTAVNEAFANLPKTDATKFVAGASGDKNKLEAGDLTPENIRILLQDAQDGGYQAAEIIKLIYGFLGSDILGDADEASATEDAGGVGQRTLQKLSEVKAQFDSGQIGVGTYLKAIRDARQDTVDSINTSLNTPGATVNPEDLKALADQDKALSDTLRSHYESQLQALEQYESLIGEGSFEMQTQTGGDVKGALLNQKISTLTAQVGDPTLSLADRGKAVDDLIKNLQAKWERDLDAIADPIERERQRKLGFTIPPELQAYLAESQLAADPEVSALVDQISAITNQAIGGYYDQMGNEIITTANTTKQVVLDTIDKAIENLLLQLSSLPGVDANAINAQIGKLRALRDSVAAGPELNQPQETGDTGYGEGEYSSPGDERRANAAANTALQRARADGDPVKEARASMRAAQDAANEAKNDAERKQAQAQMIEAQHQLRDAQNDIITAQIEATQALYKNNAIGRAQAQVSAAERAVALAKGEAAKIRANQQLQEAMQSLDEAQADAVTARIDHARAVAQAAGDSVGVAVADAQDALDKLNRLLADPHAGGPEISRAQDAVMLANAAVRDAQFDKEIGDIEFLQQMEWISTQQAIKMLEAMAAVPGRTGDQYKAILQKIKELMDASKQDYQFNLPTDIDLPTLYESRRLNQTQAGSGYNDNRQIVINFTANNTADAQSIAQTIVDGFSAPSRFGTTSRRY